MRDVKTWRVMIGDRWVEVHVIARNYIEAARKALRIVKPPKIQRFISAVEFEKSVYK